MKLSRFIAVFTLVSFAQGCANFQAKPSEEEPNISNEAAPEEITYRDFDQQKDTLYDLLVAEISSQRQQFDITLVNYIHQARTTKDPAIILRAINAAQIANDKEAIKELALVWLENEPDNIGAHQLLTYQYALDKEFQAAFEHLDRILELNGDTNVEALAITSSQLSDDQKQELLALYSELYEKHSNRWEVQYSLALVQRSLKQCDAAISNLEQVIKAQEDFQQAYIVKANCLHELSETLKTQESRSKALSFTEDAFDQFPNSNALGRLYASLLISNRNTERAESVFASLLEYYPNSPTLLLSYALLMLENGKLVDAKTQLLKVLDQNSPQSDDANYYLARIAEQENDREAAITYYQKINKGTHFNSALDRSSYLLAEDGRIDEAVQRLEILRNEKPGSAIRLWLVEYQLLSDHDQKERALDTLNKAIEEFPNDEKILYARAMHYDSMGELALMESDLRIIIENNPENAIALNALGYTLADKTDRYQEALELISVAITLLPENPAVMDSMGWVLFKLGEYEKSLQLLAAAYKRYPDGEVGAHLGEVLWTAGKRKEAAAIWGENLGRQPDHPILLETIQRLAPELLELASQAKSDDVTDSESGESNVQQATEATESQDDDTTEPK